MTQMTRWTPLESSALTPFDREFFADFNRLASGLLAGHGRLASVWKPAFDVHETEQEIVLAVDLPGVSPEDVAVEVEDGVLTVSGERRSKSERSEGTVQRLERFHGRFSRAVYLPEGVDPEAVSASYENGVLEVKVPKPKQAQPKRVAVAVGGQGQEPEVVESTTEA